MPKKDPRAAVIHANFHINVLNTDQVEGVPTQEGKVAAIRRFIRWHEAQVVIGHALLTQLEAAAVTT